MMNLRKAKAAAAAVLAVGALLLTSCADGAEKSAPQIVVTTDILADVAQVLVGDQVEILTLMGAGSDPHSFVVSAQTAAQIEDAELILYNGLGLEEGVLRIIESATLAGVASLEVGLEVEPLIYRAGGSSGEYDPHFWTDPDRMKLAASAMAATIAEHVTGIDSTLLAENLDAYLSELDELTVWMEQEFSKIPAGQRVLITHHHVFDYLAERFGFTVIGAIIPSGTTLASPSASDLDSLVRALESSGVSAIFADSTQPDRLAQVVAAEVEREIAVIPLLTESLGSVAENDEGYLGMMRRNTLAIVAGLAR